MPMAYTREARRASDLLPRSSPTIFPRSSHAASRTRHLYAPRDFLANKRAVGALSHIRVVYHFLSPPLIQTLMHVALLPALGLMRSRLAPIVTFLSQR